MPIVSLYSLTDEYAITSVVELTEEFSESVSESLDFDSTRSMSLSEFFETILNF